MTAQSYGFVCVSNRALDPKTVSNTRMHIIIYNYT